MSSSKYYRKHLQVSKRLIIEKGLINNESFTEICRKIGKEKSFGKFCNMV